MSLGSGRLDFVVYFVLFSQFVSCLSYENVDYGDSIAGMQRCVVTDGRTANSSNVREVCFLVTSGNGIRTGKYAAFRRKSAARLFRNAAAVVVAVGITKCWDLLTVVIVFLPERMN